MAELLTKALPLVGMRREAAPVRVRKRPQERLAGSTAAQAIELRSLAAFMQLTPSLTLQPDLQLFLDPTSSRRDALVPGLRAVVDL